MTIEKGKEVSIHYTLTVDGQIADTSKNKKPLKYTHGQGQIIPGLSRELEGLKAGDKKNVTINPEDAYGQVNPRAFQEIPKAKFPDDIQPQVGMNLQVSTPDGRAQLMRITAIKEDAIAVDMNHPLAGKTLNFEVEVVSVKQPGAKE